MPGTAFQLLWWLICAMDERQVVRGAWRTRAAREMQRDRIRVSRCAKILSEHDLIDVRPYTRGVKVLIENIRG